MNSSNMIGAFASMTGQRMVGIKELEGKDEAVNKVLATMRATCSLEMADFQRVATQYDQRWVALSVELKDACTKRDEEAKPGKPKPTTSNTTKGKH